MPTEAFDEAFGPESTAPATGRTSGMRPTARKPDGDAEPVPSVMGLAATVSWLLSLTMVAVDTSRVSFPVAPCIAVVQAALIVVVYASRGHRRRRPACRASARRNSCRPERVSA